jgi:ABC-2 type transport system ATP-binding protein
VVIIYRGRILLQGSWVNSSSEWGPWNMKPGIGRMDADRIEPAPGVRMQQYDETSLRFQVEHPLDANPLIVKALLDGHAPVVTFQEVPRSLEQVYLKVMAEVQEGAYAGQA